jgi:hypothetical protein
MERRQFLQEASLGVAAAALAVTSPVPVATAGTDKDKGTRLKATGLVESAGALAFGPDNVLFIGDTKGAAVHAFQLPPGAFTPQTNVLLGNAKTFEGRDLVRSIDQKLAALMGTSPDQIVINDMVAHRPSKQVFMSVHRGRGPDAIPVIVKVNDGHLEVLDLDKFPHSKVRITDVPGQETLEFGQRERNLAITDITYHKGEIFVAGISNARRRACSRRNDWRARLRQYAHRHGRLRRCNRRQGISAGHILPVLTAFLSLTGACRSSLRTASHADAANTAGCLPVRFGANPVLRCYLGEPNSIYAGRRRTGTLM